MANSYRPALLLQCLLLLLLYVGPTTPFNLSSQHATPNHQDWKQVVDDLLRTTDTPQIFPTPPQRSYFAKLGLIEPTRDWIHVHATYNLSSLYHYAKTPCRCFDIASKLFNTHNVRHNRAFLRTNVYLYHAKTAFQNQCNAATHRVTQFQTLINNATTYSNAPGHSDVRQKRGLPVLLWTAVSASVGPTGFSLAKYVLSKITSTSLIVTVVTTLLSVVNLVSMLFPSLTHNSVNLHKAYDMEAAMRQCQQDTTHFFDYMARFEEAFYQLLRHEYPTHFIHPSDILTQLPALSVALNNKNIRLLLSNPADIATLPSSFVIKDDTIHMFIHLPISHAPALTAYKYIPTPTIYEIATVPTLSTVTHINSVLAINDDMSTYVELPNLSSCTEFQTRRFLCPDTPVLHHSPDHSCLFALFTSNANNTYNYCTLHNFRRPYFATELAPTRFFLYTAKPEKASIKCATPTKLALDQPTHRTHLPNPTNQRSLPIHYISSVISLPPHCHLRVFNLSLYPASTYKTEVILSKSAFTQNTDKFFKLTQTSYGDTQYNNLATPSSSTTHNAWKQYVPHIIALLFLALSILLCFAIFAIPVFCVKKRNGRYVIKQPLRNFLNACHSRPTPTPAAATNPAHSVPMTQMSTVATYAPTRNQLPVDVSTETTPEPITTPAQTPALMAPPASVPAPATPATERALPTSMLNDRRIQRQTSTNSLYPAVPAIDPPQGGGGAAGL